MGEGIEEIIAPSACAQRTFAAAPRARRVLVEDLPGLRQLHQDLDTEARVHPGCRLLRNFRAPDAFVVRQEQEYVLASEIAVRGRFARERALRAGAREDRVVDLRRYAHGPPVMLPLAYDPRAPRVLLAGTTAARFGLEFALSALDELGGLKVLACRGEGSCETSLSDERLEPYDPGQAASVRAVVAPAWVECHPAEVSAAIVRGIPVIATRRALGWHAPSTSVVEIAPGDAAGLASALRALASYSPPASYESGTST